jgi:hypothetical protein
MHFTHRIKKVIKFNVDGARITVGVCHDQRDITHITDIGSFITGERCITGITRGVADEGTYIFLAVFNTVTVGRIVNAGIIPSYAHAALTFVNLRAEKPVVTGGGVIRMCAGSRTVTGVIGTHIKVIGTDRARRIKAAVGCLLAGVAFRFKTRAPRVYGTGPAAAGVRTVTEKAVITGCGVSWMRAGPQTVTGVIGAHIPVIGT